MYDITRNPWLHSVGLLVTNPGMEDNFLLRHLKSRVANLQLLSAVCSKNYFVMFCHVGFVVQFHVSPFFNILIDPMQRRQNATHNISKIIYTYLVKSAGGLV